MKKNKTQGYVMVGIGLLMILIAVLGYTFNWDRNFSIIFIIGLIAVAVGMNLVRK